MAETHTDLEHQKKVWDMIQDIRVAMMVTQDEDRMRSRPMVAANSTFDGVLWFFTELGSPKTDEVQQDRAVLLAYSDPGHQNYVSLSGIASIVRDPTKQKELWSEPMRAWFPKGAEDPSIALMRVTIEGAEYWDTSSSTMVYLYGYAKALATGEPARPGENEKVAFNKPRA